MSFGRELCLALRPYPPTGRYLVGVSGGRDSVALLHGLFYATGYRRLVVCHLNHGLRGREAQKDAEFVQRLAAKMDLPMEVGHSDVGALAKSLRLSSETAGREARYQFFAEVAGKHRCRTLFLAHQADDQVETFLFNLLRGAGPAGLAAMARERIRIIGRRKLKIIRPLLAVWRTEIDEYLCAEGLEWREDATNADPTHATRNRLRAQVLPLLEKTMGRETKKALWSTADILGEEETWISGLLGSEDKLPTHIPLMTLANQPIAKQRRMIRSWLLNAKVPSVGYREVELVRSLQDKTSGLAKINLPGGWHARRRAGVLFLEAPHPSK